MSVWSRIRWINVARAAGAVAALALVIAWPRLGSAPPSVPDGAPVPARPLAGGDAAGGQPTIHVAPGDDQRASSAATAHAGDAHPSGQRPSKALVDRRSGERLREGRASRRRTRGATTGSRRRRPRARSRRSIHDQSRPVPRAGARGRLHVDGRRRGVAAPDRAPHHSRVRVPTPPPSPVTPTAPPPAPPVADTGGAPSHGDFDFER